MDSWGGHLGYEDLTRAVWMSDAAVGQVRRVALRIRDPAGYVIEVVQSKPGG
jgi:hypothetical protein